MLARTLRSALSSLALLLFVYAQAFGAETVLHTFNASSGGINPSGGLLMDSSGNFYGTALDGTLFEFTRDSSGGWTYNLLCSCPGTYGYGSLVMDKSGNLYSSTYWGTVYKYSPGGAGRWTSTLLYAFNGPLGSGPSPLVADSAGDLYGTYAYGGSHNMGFVFKLAKTSDGTWAMTHVHDFAGSDGATTSQNNAYTLVAGLTIDEAGNLYGTTGQGGTSKKCSGGCGVIFELTKSSGSWTEKILHNFIGSDGSNPDAPLMIDASGNLYGTTTNGGAKGFGVVFEATAGTWQTRTLYSFTNLNGDGAYPNSALVMDTAGNLYGATESGGGSATCVVEADNGCGTIFELKNNGGGTYRESALVRFSGKGNGGFPGGASLGTDGNIYGIAEVGGTYNKGLFFEIPR